VRRGSSHCHMTPHTGLAPHHPAPDREGGEEHADLRGRDGHRVEAQVALQSQPMLASAVTPNER
jgi:hypothetical protein